MVAIGARRALSARQHVVVIHSSPVVADALAAELVRIAAAPRVDATYSWTDFVREWDFLPTWAVVDAYLDDHVPLALKVRSLVRERSGVVVLGPCYTPQLRHRVMADGVSEWLEPTLSLADTADRIRTLVRGRPNDDRRAPAAEAVSLTDRELQLAGLHASRRGSTPAAIARNLGLSANTVRSHIAAARRKYRAAGRPAGSQQELAAQLVADGYLTPDADWGRQARW